MCERQDNHRHLVWALNAIASGHAGEGLARWALQEHEAWVKEDAERREQEMLAQAQMFDLMNRGEKNASA